MFLRASQRHRPLQSASAMLKVSSISLKIGSSTNANKLVDANLFKEAFIKAQQENEALFKTE